MKAELSRRTENTVAFTTTWLSKLRPPASGREVYHDTTLPGLCLRVTPDGLGSYSIYKKFRGKPLRVTLGRADQLTLKQARDLAAVALGKIAAGINPNEEKREQEQQETRDSLTLGALWGYYLTSHAKPKKRSWKVDEQRYERHLKKWAGKPLAAVTGAAVESLHNEVGEKSGHYEANRLLSLLHKMFGTAPKIGFDGPNPAHGVERFAEESRERFIQPDEMPRFFEALATLQEESPVAADAIEVTLWTGQRRGNVLSMEWDELALQRGEWTIPGAKSKNGKPITVHLPEPAMTILLARLQTRGASPYVFPGRRHGKPLVDPYKPWKALLKASGLKDLRPHDLRRTMGSWQTATGANVQVVAKTLGHADLASTAVYARLNLDPVKQAVNTAVAAMQAAGAKTGVLPAK
jgi:integrase